MNEVPREADKAADGFRGEAVHDLRVSLRRCLSMADGFGAMDPHKDWKRMRRQAKALFDSIGGLRDCDVLREWIHRLGAADDFLTHQLLGHVDQQEPGLKDQAKRAIEAFDRKRWQNWTRSLPRRASSPSIGSDVFQAMALEKLLAGRRLQAPALKTENEAAFHRLRIGLKKFRYFVENFLPQLHQQWKAGLKIIQDLLGEIHDLDVLRGAVLALRAASPGESLQRWEKLLAAERRTRIERYSGLMSGENSLWKTWRDALPRGQAAREASLKKLQAWSAFLDTDVQHSRRVARFAVQIHDGLVRFGLLNGPNQDSRELLRAAAMVHEVGKFAGKKNHHKSTQRMIGGLNHMVGWTRQEIVTMATVARYHRGALPQAARLQGIPAKQRKLLMPLAGVLRLANALDDGHDGSIRRIKLSRQDGFIVLEAQGLRADSSLAERIAGARHLLEVTCGLPVLVRPMRV